MVLMFVDVNGIVTLKLRHENRHKVAVFKDIKKRLDEKLKLRYLFPVNE